VSVLRRLDRVLSVAGWVTAAAFALMLLVGPQVIAEDKPERGSSSAGSAVYGAGAGADGATVFSDSCGSCHTLSAAGTNGQVGPNLDDSSALAADVESIVRDGSGGMPAFGDRLSDAEVKAVAAYVEASR
jgi:mono/diheme cytochrome c family protein